MIFKGKRPTIGQLFEVNGKQYRVASIGAFGIVIGLIAYMTTATTPTHLITIKENFS
jgi:hypothetical protein